ncbi:hypothetical protein B0H10DRAFT_870342 [Mycena sp. CBHHK59/15]|nr:hypothetical protein B0H10DRAFT_870342 [Mycena sp. CBHHK59/15]
MIDAGILHVVMGRSLRPDSHAIRSDLAAFMTHLSSLTVYPPVLLKLKGAVKDLTESKDLACSAIVQEWRSFVGQFRSRLSLLEELDSGHCGSFKACDNTKCGKILRRKEFKRCSACDSRYYCSKDCQTLDWSEGGHRAECRRIQCFDFGAPWRASAKNRAFIRALLTRDYLAHKHEILSQQMTFMAQNPGEPFYVLFNYKKHVEIKVQSVCRHVFDLPADWHEFSERASRSGGCMELHVALFNEGCAGGRGRVLPMRLSSAHFHKALISSALELGTAPDPADVARKVNELQSWEVHVIH